MSPGEQTREETKASLKECSCLEASKERRNEGFVKRFGVWKQSLSRRDVFWKRANEGGTVWNLPVQKRQSALRGCLHVESTIDSYGEVIDRFAGVWLWSL